MLKLQDANFLRALLTKAFNETGDVKSYNVKSTIEYLLLDASDMYERMGDPPYGDFLVYSCIELALYREGYAQTARQFCEFWSEEYSERPKEFREESQFSRRCNKCVFEMSCIQKDNAENCKTYQKEAHDGGYYG